MSYTKIPIAISEGDGIGPAIMQSTWKIITQAGAHLDPIYIHLGLPAYAQGHTSGISSKDWETLRSTKILLKAPMTDLEGDQYKNLNITLRKAMGLFANIRPCKSLYPYISTQHPKLDIVIIHENEEDLYAGIEHQQTQDAIQCLKLVSHPGTEKIIHYAFSYARIYGRKKVTLLVKDNILKLTDGVFHRIFKKVGRSYPDLQQEVCIVNTGSAFIAQQPEKFDVIVAPNLYGDIVSDVVAQLSGSMNIVGSANIGTNMAMFEPIHGPALDIAEKNTANPSGLLHAAIMMLIHIGQQDIADKVKNAWLATIEAGLHTPDIHQAPYSQGSAVGTKTFTQAVLDRLGHKPTHLSLSLNKTASTVIRVPDYIQKVKEKELVGVDVFISWNGSNPQEIGDYLVSCTKECALQLKLITNRGMKVYPTSFSETFCTDHWQCRFILKNELDAYKIFQYDKIVELLTVLHHCKVQVIKTENLYYFDKVRGFSLAHGE